ncbi:MAG: PAS domain S-box protein, partial [Deltaproteobacteria bacterium]|nr:PAS domain S-box protein [Deltaproteobacteria bacterium]
FVDITKRKKVEETLIESERRLSDIINFLPDATFAIDSEGTVIAWNYAIEEMTGVKAADMLGKGNYEYAIPFYGYRRPILIDLIGKPDREIEEKYVFLRKEKDVLIVETDVAKMKGKSVYLWGKASPIYDLNGDVIGAIESTRDITERRQMEKNLLNREAELEEKSRYLEEANTALKVLLEQREKDKKEIEENVLINVEKSLLPYLEKVKNSNNPKEQNTYLDILESNINSIASPFYRNVTLRNFNLTPKEIEIATLIKEGKSTKEIAELLVLSPRTIDLHRLNIRRKLGLKSKRVNLRSTLLSYS